MAATSASAIATEALSVLVATWHEGRAGFDYAVDPLRGWAGAMDALFPAQALWSWYLRGVSGALAVGCASLAMQVGVMGSTKGVWPIKARFDRMRSDYPAMARFLYFPSWLHLCHADWMLPSLLTAGAAIGLGLVWSSLASRTGLVVMWSIYLSFASVLNLRSASDNLLLEMGFLSLFFPSLDTRSWSLAQAPLPLLTFSVQCLLARRVVGSMASKFFVGAKLSDLSLSPSTPPPLTRLGWLLHQLPHGVQLASSCFVVLAALVAALLCFVPGWPRLPALLIVLTLQFGAALTSAASGFLALLTCVLSVSLLDVKASLVADFRSASLDPSDVAANAVLACVLLLHCARLPCFDSLWSDAAEGPASKVASLLRLLSPWRLSHSCAQLSCSSLLPPSASSRYLWISVIEACAEEVIDPARSHDAAFVAAQKAAGKVLATEACWEPYNYKSLPSSEAFVPALSAFSAVSSRIEQAIMSESLGLGLFQARRSPLDSTDPYSAESGPLPSTHTLTQVCAALLRGNAAIEDMFTSSPFGARSPSARSAKAIRVSMFLLEPTSLPVMRKTGRWFQQHYSHAVLPVMTLQVVQSGQAGCLRLREPELLDSALWTRRSRPVQQLLAKVHATPEKELTSLVAAHDTSELTAIKAAERARVGSSSVAPILRAHAAAMESSGPAPAFAFQCTTLSEADIHAFWSDLVKPLQPLIKSLHCPAPDLDNIAAPLRPLQNGSRNAGLSDTVLQRARNHGFKTDHPWNLAEPEHFTRVLREMHGSALWAHMDPERRERHVMALARLTIVMLERLRPMYHGPGVNEPSHSVWSDREGVTPASPRLDCSASAAHLHLPSMHHLRLFSHHIIGHGAAVYERLLRDPSQAVGMLSCYSIESGMVLSALFQQQRMQHLARHRRMLSCMVHPAAMKLEGALSGSLSVYYSFLGTQFKPVGTTAGDEESFPEMAPLDAPPRFFARQWKLDATEMPKQGPGKRSDSSSSSSSNGSGTAISAAEDLETIAAIGRTSSRVSASSKKRQ